MTCTQRERDLHDGGDFPHKLIRRDGLAVRQHVLLSNLAGLSYQYPRVRPHAWPASTSAQARAGRQPARRALKGGKQKMQSECSGVQRTVDNRDMHGTLCHT